MTEIKPRVIMAVASDKPKSLRDQPMGRLREALVASGVITPTEMEYRYPERPPLSPTQTANLRNKLINTGVIKPVANLRSRDDLLN